MIAAALRLLSQVTSSVPGAEYQWEDLLAAIDEVSSAPLGPDAEKVLLALLRFDEEIPLTESSELPHSMSPEDMLKSLAIQTLAEWTGPTHLEEIRRVEASASSPLNSIARAVIRKVTDGSQQQAEPPPPDLTSGSPPIIDQPSPTQSRLASLQVAFLWIVSQVRHGLAWLQAAFLSSSPPVLFVAYMFYAVLMILLTEAASLARLQVEEGTREKGYLLELNWGVNHLVAIPIVLFCCARLLQVIPVQIKQLAAAQMAVDARFEALKEDDLIQDWKRYEIGPRWFSVLAFLAFLMTYTEWWVGSALPILSYNPDSLPPVGRQHGWTTGKLLDPNHVAGWANLALTFVAFTAQWFVVLVFGYVLATILAFSIWIYGYGGPVGQRLIPSLTSKDPRKGFEIFEPIINCLIYVGISFAITLFLIRVQSIYDSSESHNQTVFHFILQSVIKGFVSNLSRLVSGESTDLFDAGNATNYSTRIVFAAMSVLLTVIMVVPTLILSVLAQESKRALQECASQPGCPPCNVHGLTREQCEQQLAGMDFWPLRSIRPMQLIAYIIFVGFCFVFYKFTFLLLGALIIRTVRSLLRDQNAQRVLARPIQP